jgi:hypothetical protein
MAMELRRGAALTFRGRAAEYRGDVFRELRSAQRETTVHDAAYDVLRSFGMRTVFGNPAPTST